jgi:septal ring factor EnvC (AmiA/AmiB activator)
LIESGEVTEDDIESISDTIDIKAENYAKVIKNQEGNINALKTEINRLTDKKKSIENNIDRMKESLKDSMITTGKERIKTDLFNISVANNPPALKITNESIIPKSYFTTETIKKLDKARLKEDLKTGNIFVNGAELTAGKRLRIK